MSRIFVSHSSKDNRQAQALRVWLVAQDPPLANEIFLDTDPDTGLKPGVKWKNELVSANSRCEAVICLLSTNWESSPECLAEYRTAENLGKQILCARLQDGTGRYTSEWQHTDLFADGLPDEDVETIAVRGGAPVVIVNPSTPVGALDFKPTPTGRIIVDFLNRRMPAYVEPAASTRRKKTAAANTVRMPSEKTRPVANAKRPIRTTAVSPIGNFSAIIAGK